MDFNFEFEATKLSIIAQLNIAVPHPGSSIEIWLLSDFAMLPINRAIAEGVRNCPLFFFWFWVTNTEYDNPILSA